MQRSQSERNGLKLPKALTEQLGLDVPREEFNGSRSIRQKSLGRKDQRKAARYEKKHRSRDPRSHGSAFVKGDVLDTTSDFEPPRKKQKKSTDEKPPLAQAKAVPAQPKSILKKRSVRPASPVLDDVSESTGESERSQSPGLVLDGDSRSFKEHMAQDDAEIAALEKKLGIKGKKLPKSFDDELAFLLEGVDEIDGESDLKKKKREGQEWLAGKRQKVLEAHDPVYSEGEEAEDDLGLDDLSGSDNETDEEVYENVEGYSDEDLSDPGLEADEDDALDSDDEDFEGFESEGDGAHPSPPKQRENPYVAPVSGNGPSTTTKYVPPSLRKASGATDESISRLRRQLQGQVNKLSEANIISIVAEIEKLYQTHPRQDVTSTLIDILLTSFSDRSQLQNTFVILHAAFIGTLYKVVGTDFGAEVVSRFVGEFDKFYDSESGQPSKEPVNFISLLSYLYTFNVISSVLVFDYIRLFLSSLSEPNTELLLKVVRDCGPQLRQDDPSSLKEIVLIMQGTIAKATQNNQPVSVRTRFMIETITDLKNNKLKSGAAGTTVAIEHITRMRKVLGSLNASRTIKASEPLRISLADIKDSDKRGKWWLVGASWKETEGHPISHVANKESIRVAVEDEGEPDLVMLAQQHRMNTSIRRSIFIAIMSASDFRDAHLRLMKLRLKKSQELEMPRVLLHCSGAEDAYNPYYTLIAKRLCSGNKKMRMALQFALWGFFKRLGERPDDEDDEEDDEESVGLKEIVNLAKMFAHLITEGTVTVNILKVLNIAYLKDQAKMFLEVLLITTITRSQAGSATEYSEKPLVNIFLRAGETPTMAKGLQYFVKKVLRKTDLVNSKKETKMVQWACGVINEALSASDRLPVFEDDIDGSDYGFD